MTEVRRRRGLAAESGGRQAETAACAALGRDGWTVLRRRARTPAGEIDIVARRDAMVAFIEVKQRPTLQEAAQALSLHQSGRMQRAAAILLAENLDWQACDLRFDVLLVDRSGQVRRITDALRRDKCEE